MHSRSLIALAIVAASWTTQIVPATAAAAAAAAASAAPAFSTVLPVATTAASAEHDDLERRNSSTIGRPLVPQGATFGQTIKSNTPLRILCVGDSITVGYPSTDGNGYRGELQRALSGNDVVFAGTERFGQMTDGYYAAWSGKTIKFIADHVGPSLEQQPNVILLHAGTNDAATSRFTSTDGNDPAQAVERLGALVDQMLEACPDAVIIVAMLIDHGVGPACDPARASRTREIARRVPDMVAERSREGHHHVLAANFTSISTDLLLDDCIHPSDEGYREIGRYWYDFITQIPTDWIQEPSGSDPVRLIEDPEKGNEEDGAVRPVFSMAALIGLLLVLLLHF